MNVVPGLLGVLLSFSNGILSPLLGNLEALGEVSNMLMGLHELLLIFLEEILEPLDLILLLLEELKIDSDVILLSLLSWDYWGISL